VVKSKHPLLVVKKKAPNGAFFMSEKYRMIIDITVMSKPPQDAGFSLN
jgi:hypothetical protein